MYGIGRRVAVCGPGALAAEVALFLAGWGRRPTVIVPGDHGDPFPDVHPQHGARLGERLLGYRCELVTGTKPVAWHDARDRKSKLTVKRGDEVITLGPFQTAVDCSNWPLPSNAADKVLMVGDSASANDLRQLVRAANINARTI
jgi:thioredoxin reductase